MTDPNENPFASPAVVDELRPVSVEMVDSEDDRIRRELIGTEMSIRSIGQFSVVLGILCTVIAIPLIANRQLIAFLAWWCVAAVLFGLGYGIVALKSWARWPAAVTLTVLAILLFGASLASGIGVLMIVVPFVAYLVYLFAGKKGARVMTPEYVAIRRETPYIKYRPTSISWTPATIVMVVVFVGLLSLLLFR